MLTLTRIGNLVFASFFMLMIIGRDWRWAGSSAPSPHVPVPLYGVLLTASICIWFASAIFLFFRSRIAWFGSIVGVALAISFYVFVIASVVREFFFPNAQQAHDQAAVIGGTVSLIFLYVLCVAFFAFWFALAIGLFVGLLKMRRDLRKNDADAS